VLRAGLGTAGWTRLAESAVPVALWLLGGSIVIRSEFYSWENTHADTLRTDALTER